MLLTKARLLALQREFDHRLVHALVVGFFTDVDLLEQHEARNAAHLAPLRGHLLLAPQDSSGFFPSAMSRDRLSASF